MDKSLRDDIIRLENTLKSRAKLWAQARRNALKIERDLRLQLDARDKYDKSLVRLLYIKIYTSIHKLIWRLKKD